MFMFLAIPFLNPALTYLLQFHPQYPLFLPHTTQKDHTYPLQLLPILTPLKCIPASCLSTLVPSSAVTLSPPSWFHGPAPSFLTMLQPLCQAPKPSLKSIYP